jgi:GNAT superfamily N-acetyltransferase
MNLPRYFLASAPAPDPASREARPPVGVRHLITRDLPAVRAIHRACDLPGGIPPGDLARAAEGYGRIGFIAIDPRDRELVAGYAVVEFGLSAVRLLALGVREDCRRLGAGRALVRKALEKLDGGRNRAIVTVSERRREACRLLAVEGFSSRLVRAGAFGPDVKRDGANEDDAIEFARRYEREGWPWASSPSS